MGGTIGGLAFIAIIVVALYYFFRRRRLNRKLESSQTQPQPQQDLDSELITYGQPAPPAYETHELMPSAGKHMSTVIQRLGVSLTN